MTTDESAPSSIAMVDEAAARIRVHLNIRASDIGFEVLHHQLALLKSGGERARFVKKQLIKLGLGQTLGAFPTGSTSSTVKNIKVDFGLSSRNVGLEKLFEDLSKLSTALERNQYVKRCLYNGFANTKHSSPVNAQLAEPRREVATLSTTQSAPSTEISASNPWASSDLVSTQTAPTAEEAAAKRSMRKRANVAMFTSQ